jgi:hypothetical protein
MQMENKCLSEFRTKSDSIQPSTLCRMHRGQYDCILPFMFLISLLVPHPTSRRYPLVAIPPPRGGSYYMLTFARLRLTFQNEYCPESH